MWIETSSAFSLSGILCGEEFSTCQETHPQTPSVKSLAATSLMYTVVTPLCSCIAVVRKLRGPVMQCVPVNRVRQVSPMLFCFYHKVSTSALQCVAQEWGQRTVWDWVFFAWIQLIVLETMFVTPLCCILNNYINKLYLYNALRGWSRI